MGTENRLQLSTNTLGKVWIYPFSSALRYGLDSRADRALQPLLVNSLGEEQMNWRSVGHGARNSTVYKPNCCWRHSNNSWCVKCCGRHTLQWCIRNLRKCFYRMNAALIFCQNILVIIIVHGDKDQFWPPLFFCFNIRFLLADICFKYTVIKVQFLITRRDIKIQNIYG